MLIASVYSKKIGLNKFNYSIIKNDINKFDTILEINNDKIKSTLDNYEDANNWILKKINTNVYLGDNDD